MDIHRQESSESVPGPGGETSPDQLHHGGELGLHLGQELDQSPGARMLWFVGCINVIGNYFNLSVLLLLYSRVFVRDHFKITTGFTDI